MASSAPRGLRSDHVVTVGIALFSMLFGAGNLIIPPLLALQAGSATPVAMLGFLIAAIGLPVMGFIAVALAGTARELAGRVHPKFGEFFVAAVYLAIGPCLAIPRTSSTAFEMLVPLLPEGVSLGTARLVFAVGFFVVAFALTLRPGVITRVLGRITGPALIALIVLVVGAAVVSPLGPAAAPQTPYDAGAAVQGFLTGYQTMDLLASLAFGIIIAETIHELGVTDDKRVAFEISRSGVIAGVLMAIIYCGLALAGMQLGTVMPDATNGAAILALSASMHFGLVGTVVVFAIFFLACMNVCIGLISCCSRYFCETYVVEGGAEASEEAMRRPFAILAFVFAAFSCVLSNVGLDMILMFSVPMLNALYPVAIVLVLMGLVHGFCDAHPQVWVWVGGVVAVQSVITSVRDAFFAGAWLPFDALPLADIGAAWAPVAVVAFVIGLPVMGFIAVALAGTARELAGRVHPKFGEFFVAAVYLAIGPCLAIPRTSSTAFEMLVPLLPEGVSLGTARLVFAVGFFVVAFALTLRPGVITRVLGRITGPALIALIVLVVGAAVVSPLGPAAAPQTPYDAGAAVQGFLTGYQTMDLLASLAFGIIIAETIHELGVTDDKRVAFEISRSGVIAGVLMAIIYCGLALAGMQLGTVMPDATNGAAILALSASMHFGLVGTVVVFAIFFLACMNVCIGLISCCSRYFCETYVVEGGAEASEEAMRRPFAILAFVFAAFSCVLSNVGLDMILMFSVPMLNALYPVAIVLVLMGLVHGFCDAHPQVWVWVGGVVAVQSVITSVRDAFFAGAWLPFDALPLADIGAAWAPVAVVAFVIGLLHSRFVAHSRS